ncbi:MAG TPA: M48 family metalloprotease, partial [Parachlamydiaceae bacterium]|nr:M48 family metalloprotease [Parachlamydiaceae bacterium]
MEQSNNFKTRLIVAVVIGMIGLFMYMSNMEVNPVTGVKQHVAISPDQEIRLGLESAPQMAREMGGELPPTDPRTIEVQKIGNYIISSAVDGKSPWKFKFHLLADKKTVNAFALPGGQIFITLGLLDKLQTEAQLAGVLSHEIG